MERTPFLTHDSAKGLLRSSASLVGLCRVNCPGTCIVTPALSCFGNLSTWPIDTQPVVFKDNPVEGSFRKSGWEVCHPGPAPGVWLQLCIMPWGQNSPCTWSSTLDPLHSHAVHTASLSECGDASGVTTLPHRCSPAHPGTSRRFSPSPASFICVAFPDSAVVYFKC